MRIKYWILTLAATLMLSSGLWAQGYPQQANGAKVVQASYRGDRYRADRREHRQHKRHHERRHDRRHESRQEWRHDNHQRGR
jgi:hypothetical protein